jgi:hypothetical protein
MNKTWNNEKLVAWQAGGLRATRRNEAKFRRNYRSVEKKMITKSSHAVGMRPVCHTLNIPFYVITVDGIVHGRIRGVNQVNFEGKTQYIEDIVFGNYSLKK